jgi:hypothetical protein
VLRANVVRPPGGERYPVVLSIHPYGKDNLPTRRGKRWTYSFQYHVLRQPEPASLDRGNPPDRRSFEAAVSRNDVPDELAPDPTQQGPLGYSQCRFWRTSLSLNYLVGQSV